MKIVMAESIYLDSDLKLGAHHIANMLSKNHEVFYLSCPITPFHFLTKRVDSLDTRFRIYINKGMIKGNSLIEYVPLTCIPTNKNILEKSTILTKKMVKFCFPSIRSILAKYGFEKIDLLIISNPRMYGLIKLLKPKKVVYRVADDYSKLDSMPKNIDIIEKELAKKVDYIITMSKPLQNKFKYYRSSDDENVFYVSNGVNLTNFIKNKYNQPDDYKNNQFIKKVIYVGAIDNWFNSDLLINLAKEYPQFGFYILGKPKIQIDAMRNMDNIKFLGFKKYEDIPNYLYYSDAGIIPFKLNELINCVSPLKLYEYSSVGLPTVTTNWSELDNINERGIFKANTMEEFARYLKQAVNLGKCKSLIDFAQENSWENKCEKIISFCKINA